jgi:hypothetical protein
MLKLSCTALVLLGICATKACVAQNEHPLVQLQGTSRVLMIFSPDTNSSSYRRQLELIEHHNFELTERNTVVVPIAFVNHGSEDRFAGENLILGSAAEQAYARNRFHVQPGQFLVVLLNSDGTERLRSDSPIDIHELTAQLAVLPKRLK